MLVAATLIATSAPLVGAGNQSSPASKTQVRTAHGKGRMTEQNRSDIRDVVLDNLREVLKQNARSSARDVHSACGGMH
jgi:hypothetical protein